MTSHRQAVEIAWQTLPDDVAGDLTFGKVEAAIVASCNARQMRIHDDEDARRAQLKAIILDEIRGRVAISQLLKRPKLKKSDAKFVISLVQELHKSGDVSLKYDGYRGSVTRRRGWTVQ